MPRIAITFRLTSVAQQQDLLREFGLHEGVMAHATGPEGDPLLTVETGDSHAAIWDVRSTVGIFDEHAVEVPDSPEDESV